MYFQYIALITELSEFHIHPPPVVGVWDYIHGRIVLSSSYNKGLCLFRMMDYYMTSLVITIKITHIGVPHYTWTRTPPNSLGGVSWVR